MTRHTGNQGHKETCDIHTCQGSRSYFVSKQDNTRGVCVRCMEELVTAFGWKLVGGRLTEPTRPVSQQPTGV